MVAEILRPACESGNEGITEGDREGLWICGFVDLWIWGFGDLGIWRFGAWRTAFGKSPSPQIAWSPSARLAYPPLLPVTVTDFEFSVDGLVTRSAYSPATVRLRSTVNDVADTVPIPSLITVTSPVGSVSVT